MALFSTGYSCSVVVGLGGRSVMAYVTCLLYNVADWDLWWFCSPHIASDWVRWFDDRSGQRSWRLTRCSAVGCAAGEAAAVRSSGFSGTWKVLLNVCHCIAQFLRSCLTVVDWHSADLQCIISSSPSHGICCAGLISALYILTNGWQGTMG